MSAVKTRGTLGAVDRIISKSSPHDLAETSDRLAEHRRFASVAFAPSISAAEVAVA